MTSQFSLFEMTETNDDLDIRTEQQSLKKVAYDVGEKVGGARKDLAALRKAFEENQSASVLEEIESSSAILAAEIVNKKELFRSFNLLTEKENGVEPAVARAKQLLFQRIDSTPSVDSKEVRLSFMTAAHYLLDSISKVKTMDELYAYLNNLATLLRHELYNLTGLEKLLGQIKLDLDSLPKDSDEWRLAYKRGINAKRDILNCRKAQEIGLRSLGDKFINFFRSKSSYTSTLTNALKVESWDELLIKKEKKKGIARKLVWERHLPERPDRTGGAISTVEKPEDLLTFFHLRGAEFGHYMDDSKGMEHLLRSSEAMMDLAELLGLDYTSISLNGTLAMAYGARGRGGSALAHYEPLSKVINMTKEKGSLGVFAHEWFHGLDNHLYDLSHNSKNGKRGYASEPETLGQHVDSFLKLLFEELIDLIKEGNSISYFENTNKPGERWRGYDFKSAYQRHNGNVLEAMTERINSKKRRMEEDVTFAQTYYGSQKEGEKIRNKYLRNLKKFALALAWYHEDQTGEKIDYIPYPSDKSPYFQASIKLDKGKEGKYWSKDLEMTARAFESFIQDKLKAAGRVSDYLVAGTRDSLAFPMDEHRLAINNKFEEIFKFIRELKLI
ncbi:hypothetical protein AWM68_17350 [Fictibacillus phosphorivorans]|uniref:Large polyvalent protein-associated domain-containing protein n=1 Tax=Fictibacillus phosphorivorans TaxID=1221500 RepID=A0A163S178_9BACL|nr:LPD1 domain-containing protein [Fictibacillus phosphorivorans]KZE67939.1 hypothetical protein AWM68_17350 [Fictibacillus phosphorivorans]